MPLMYETPEKEIEARVKKAKETGCWFYNSSIREWLTPEEYEQLAHTLLISEGRDNRMIFNKYDISDPRGEIQQKMNQLNRANNDMQVFTIKVFNYFNLTHKGKEYKRHYS